MLMSSPPFQQLDESKIHFGWFLRQYMNAPYELQRKLRIIVEFYSVLLFIVLFFLIADLLAPKISIFLIFGDFLALFMNIFALISVKLHKLEWISRTQYLFYVLLVTNQILPEIYATGNRPIESLYITVVFLSILHILMYLINIKRGIHIIQTFLSNSVLLFHYGVLYHLNQSTWGWAFFQLLMAIILMNLGILLINRIIWFNQSLIQRVHEEEEQKLEILTKVVEGFVPICCNCKSIRVQMPGEEEKWITIETYLQQKSNNVRFSHGLCQKCADEVYPTKNE